MVASAAAAASHADPPPARSGAPSLGHDAPSNAYTSWRVPAASPDTSAVAPPAAVRQPPVPEPPGPSTTYDHAPPPARPSSDTSSDDDVTPPTPTDTGPVVVKNQAIVLHSTDIGAIPQPASLQAMTPCVVFASSPETTAEAVPAATPTQAADAYPDSDFQTWRHQGPDQFDIRSVAESSPTFPIDSAGRGPASAASVENSTVANRSMRLQARPRYMAPR